MTLYFITSNENKFKEAKEFLGDKVKHLEIDVPEIQSMDPHKIIKAKLEAAFEHHEGEFIVEDVSMQIECLNGFPGPLAKWFFKTVTNQGIVNIVEKLGNNKAEITTIIGYAKSRENIHFIEDTIKGKLVQPRGENGWGFDPVFESEELGKTFSELTDREKAKLSHRGLALKKLQDFLKQ